MGFTVTMQTPYILVEPSVSGEGLVTLNNVSQFGTVFQVNAGTTVCSIGDVVYYNIADTSSIQESAGSIIYTAIDESKIIFVEG